MLSDFLNVIFAHCLVYLFEPSWGMPFSLPPGFRLLAALLLAA
jgi:hypothetical protein